MMILLLPSLENAISKTMLIIRSAKPSNHAICVQQSITAAGVENHSNVFLEMKIWLSVLMIASMAGFFRPSDAELR